MSSDSRSRRPNALRHMCRALVPHSCSSAPPVLLAIVTVTQPALDWL